MRPALQAAVMTVAVGLGAASGEVTRAAPAEPFVASTHVVAVPDADHVVVAVGRRDHFPADVKGLQVSPRSEPRPDRKAPPVDFGVVIALADVERVEESTATLRLYDVVRAPKVGDHVAWPLALDGRSAELLDSPLFWAAALDIGARELDTDRELFRLADFFDDPKAEARIVRAMVDEVHRHARLAADVYAEPFDHGRLAGQRLTDVFARTNAKDVLEFWDSVVATPSAYITYAFRFVDIYGTWLLRGAPLAAPVKTRRVIARLELELGQMLRTARWEAAEKRLVEILRLMPGDPSRASELEAVLTIRRTEAALARDPEDASAAWSRARALYDLKLYNAALPELQRLAARGYRAFEASRIIGWALCGAGQWLACEQHFDRLISERGKRRDPDPELEKWRTYARTRGVSSGNEPTGDATQQMETARAMESEGAWEDAVSAWRNALMLARERAQPAAVRQAEVGLERATRRMAMAARLDEGVAALQVHDLVVARAVLADVLAQGRSMSEPEAAVSELGRLAAAARAVGERAFDVEVLTVRVAEVGGPPACVGLACRARGGALADLAEARAEAGDLAGAEALFEEAVKLAPDDLRARGKRAWFFAELGRWSDAYAVSFMGASQNLLMGYAMVRASVARKRWDEAIERAERVARTRPELGRVAAAVHRLADLDRRSGADAPREVDPAVVPGGDPTVEPVVDPEVAARALLRRVRALAELGLERLAAAELPALASHPALQREAAWAIARRPQARPDAIDLFPLADRLAAAELAAEVPTAERVRRRDHLRALARHRREPTAATRRALAEASLAEGELHAAWALVPEDATFVGRVRTALEGQTSLAHARAARDRGDDAAAIDLAKTALAKLADVPAAHLDARYVLAAALVELGQREAAFRVASDGLAEAKREGEPERVRAFEVLIARLGVRQESGRSGLELFEALLIGHRAGCAALDDDRCAAETAFALGLLDIQRGRVTEARRELDLALGAFDALFDRARARAVTMAIVRVLRLRSELAQAATRAEEVLHAAVDDGDGAAERQALLELGSLALSEGDLAAARTWLSAAREAAERGDDETSRARSSADLGRAEYLLGGDPERARRSLEEAIARFDRHGAPGDALEARIDLAEALLSAARDGRSAPGKKRGDGSGRARDKVLGRAAELVRDAPAAAAGLGRDVLRLRALLALAAVRLEQHKTGELDALFDQASALAERIELPELRARTAYLRARGLLLSDRAAAASLALDAARTLAEPLARGTLPLGRAETQAIFQETADLLFELGRQDDALELLELHATAAAARTFDLDRLRRASSPDLAAGLGQLADARARADAIDARLREVADRPDAPARTELVRLQAASRAELAALSAELERAHPEHWKALARDPKSLASERKRLPKGTILVEYFVSEQALYLFIARPGATPLTPIKVGVDLAQLGDTIARHRKLLATDARLAEPLGRQLHAWLLAPLDEVVPAAARADATLILLPQGPLLDVPFAALVASPPGAPVRYAIADWRLAVASARTLAPLLSGPRKLGVVGPVLGLADPDGSLPEARRELDAMPPALPTTVLRGADATEERLLALGPGFRILHFATHGSLAKNPLDSSLLLASGPLTVERIAGLDALRGHIALVFLSACRSATEVGSGEADAVSLAEGFAMAGVPTLIASLWDVDDRATRALVEGFYRALARPGEDTLGALRAAQLEAIAGSADGTHPYADPRFWSAFQLIGDFR